MLNPTVLPRLGNLTSAGSASRVYFRLLSLLFVSQPHTGFAYTAKAWIQQREFFWMHIGTNQTKIDRADGLNGEIVRKPQRAFRESQQATVSPVSQILVSAHPNEAVQVGVSQRQRRFDVPIPRCLGSLPFI